MKRSILMIVVTGILAVWAISGLVAEECAGIFVDPNTILTAQDPMFLREAPNQIRLYQKLRVGQKLDLTFTVCDPDGDPFAPVQAYLIPPDCTWSSNGAQLTVRYTARSPAKRDIIAFTLRDAPTDPNTTPASRIAAIIVDVTKNNPPLFR